MFISPLKQHIESTQIIQAHIKDPAYIRSNESLMIVTYISTNLLLLALFYLH